MENFHIIKEIIKEPNRHEHFSYGWNLVSEKKHIFFLKITSTSTGNLKCISVSRSSGPYEVRLYSSAI